MLSGYLITTLALREEAITGRLNLKSFYIRRVFRIYPIYFAVLLAYVVLLLGFGMQSERRAIFLDTLPFYIFFFPERPVLLQGDASGVPFAGAWSLGIEEKFYLVWPLLGFVILAWKFRARLASLLVMGAGFTATAMLGDIGSILQPYALIAVGCISAVLLHDQVWYERLQFLGKGWMLLMSTALLALMQFFTDDGFVQSIYYGLVVAVVISGLVMTTTASVRWLASRPMLFLGKISYVFYLTHNFGINAAEMVIPQGAASFAALSAVIGLGISVGIAWVLHFVIEKPMIQIGHRVAHRYKPGAQIQARRTDTSQLRGSPQ